MRNQLLIATIVSVSAFAQTRVPPEPGSVTIPIEEYNKLTDLANKPPKKTDAPPFAYAVRSVQMNLRVQGESVGGTVLLEGETFGKGYRKVPLVSGMVVTDARQRGKDLPIEQSGGVHTALLPGPGDFAVTLETGLSVNIEPGRASFQFLAPAAGAVRLKLSLPGEHTLLDLNPGLITSRESSDGRTTVEATLVPGTATTIGWAARVTAPVAPVAPKPVRFLSDVKTLISVNEAELTIAAVADVTVIQGYPTQFELQPPAGYEITGATGPTLASSGMEGKSLVLHVTNARSHQFLISLRKNNATAPATIPLIAFTGAQRETGEVLVEGEGAMELTATEQGVMHRMDIKEISPYLRSLSRETQYAAFRYQRKTESPAVALQWTRFPESRVLSAVAQQAVVTTLVTSEGRSLTEVKLTLKNQSQPFVKVALPAGATIVTADVAGVKVKPVQGTDGARVPLLRPGFRPTQSYTVSFVFMHAGAPFEKKGGAELSLPKMDIPIGLLQWEVFLPDRYKLTDFGGDAISTRLIPPPGEDASEGTNEAPTVLGYVDFESMGPGSIGGVITDAIGAVVPRATVTVTHTGTGVVRQTYTDSVGRWIVADFPAGPVRITATAPGFSASASQGNHDLNRASRFDLALRVGAISETVEVMANAGAVQTQQTFKALAKKLENNQASSNVTQLQQRVAGVLPIAVTVPHAGSSYSFVRPLVVDEETKLTFNYRGK